MSIDLLVVDQDEAEDILAVGQAMDVIGNLFVQREGTPEALQMVVAQLRMAADVLEQINERWQSKIGATAHESVHDAPESAE